MVTDSATTITGSPYRPYRWAAADYQLGLRRIQPESWILMGAGHVELMRQKCGRLDQQRTFYYRTLPDSLPAQRELRDRVTAHLVAGPSALVRQARHRGPIAPHRTDAGSG